jgi:uncharacterized protein (TIGR02611 family)
MYRRSPPAVRRIVVPVVGVLLLCVGAALLVLPGPGLVVLLAGVAVLSLELKWARRLLARARSAAGRFQRRRDS